MCHEGTTLSRDTITTVAIYFTTPTLTDVELNASLDFKHWCLADVLVYIALLPVFMFDYCSASFPVCLFYIPKRLNGKYKN